MIQHGKLKRGSSDDGDDTDGDDYDDAAGNGNGLGEDDHNRAAMPSAAERDKSFCQVFADVGKRDFLLEIAQD